jgi:hypothetical protein
MVHYIIRRAWLLLTCIVGAITAAIVIVMAIPASAQGVSGPYAGTDNEGTFVASVAQFDGNPVTVGDYLKMGGQSYEVANARVVGSEEMMRVSAQLPASDNGHELAFYVVQS